MIALLQRVSAARVRIDDAVVAEIGPGLAVLVGVQPQDSEANAHRLLERVLKYRIFGDERGKLNVSLQQMGGALLLVPQFTLAADTRHGLRPGFSTAAAPELGRRLFDALVEQARRHHPAVASGQFGANMQVWLVNEGPVTFWLES